MSIPSVLLVHEVDGIIQVCAILSTMENTESDFTITLATNYSKGIVNK